IELLDAPNGDRTLGTDPATGRTVVARSGRFGPYVALESEDESKPATQSLFKTMDLESVTLDDALRLLSLPRTVGTHPDAGTKITAQNGRYGPYIKMGDETRSLDDEEQIFTVTVEEAVERLSGPRRRGARTAAPLRELGADPDTGKAVVVKDGRFGPYVTDGEVNASLRTGDTVDSIDLDRGLELLAARRERIASGKGGKRGRR
ncbi:MAG: topoisomerase C-terminal repeat-containing protein, partial [Acidimicrobiia bacterium]